MDISLLKELNEMTREMDEFENALKEAEMEFDVDLSDDEYEGADDDMDADEIDYDSIELDDEELQRIADHWEAEGAEMEDDDLADAIGDELEQLEYSPEEISAGISRVMSMLGRDDYFGEPSDEDLGDIEGGADFDPDDELGGSERF
jgi:hypothetical protein